MPSATRSSFHDGLTSLHGVFQSFLTETVHSRVRLGTAPARIRFPLRIRAHGPRRIHAYSIAVHFKAFI